MTLKLHNSALVMVSSNIMFWFFLFYFQMTLRNKSIECFLRPRGNALNNSTLLHLLQPFYYIQFHIDSASQRNKWDRRFCLPLGFSTRLNTQHNGCGIKCSVEREQLLFKQRRVELSRALWLHKGGLRHQNLCYVYSTHDIGHIIMVEVKNINTFLQVFWHRK